MRVAGATGWPARYPIDQRGHVRYVHFGEGDHEQTERAIRSLLADPGEPAKPGRTLTAGAEATPETYPGVARAERFTPELRPGTHTHTLADDLPQSGFSLGGTWAIEEEAATAKHDGVCNHTPGFRHPITDPPCGQAGSG